GAGQESAVVAGIVPGEPALVAAVLPECGPEFDRFDRWLAVERDSLAVLLDLLAAPRPQIRIEKGRRVAEAVSHGLAEWLALGLELLAGVAILVPGFRKFVVADRVEPRFAIGIFIAEDAPRHSEPFLAIVGDGNRFLVKAALVLAEFLGNLADVGDAFGIQLRPVVQRANDVRDGARLNGGRSARLNVIAVDHLDIERDAEILGGCRYDLLAQNFIRAGNEIVPAQPVYGRALRIGRRPATCQNRSNPSGSCRNRASAGKLKQLAPMNSSHWNPPFSLIVEVSYRCNLLARFTGPRSRTTPI